MTVALLAVFLSGGATIDGAGVLDAAARTSLRLTFHLGGCAGAVCGRFGTRRATGSMSELHLLDEHLAISPELLPLPARVSGIPKPARQ
jgi:hypothetical protein